MKTLNDSQTDLIIKWVRSNHLTISSLENEFIDHICCDVEELLNEGISFKTAFEGIRKELGDDILMGLEKQTILKLTYNQRIMKFMTRLVGIIVLLSFFTAIVTRVFGSESWKTLMAGGMLVLGLGFAPLFFYDHYQHHESKGQKVLHIFGFLSALLVPISAFLGLLNSQYSIIVMAAGIIFLILGFIPLSWISVSKGPARNTFAGSIIFLLFIVVLAFGFLNVRLSKEKLNSWVHISNSTKQSAINLGEMNSDFMTELSSDTVALKLAYEISERSNKLVNRISAFRDGFILKLDPSYNGSDLFFHGMDSHYAGSDLLIKSEKTDMILLDLMEYEEWLNSMISDENDKVKQKISGILKHSFSMRENDLSMQKKYLFRDFPAITDVAVLNSLILNIRMAEYQSLRFLSEAESKNL